ncbi:hypothetical protein PIB30_095140 [Stylosanthes scabra]|uniref:Uncharacterized protein n=1 Tax=Stylosanthes scabra TaxID=79078 RepID=A0ABU6YTB8_9FABA|nr:hypothetical protein [Stylosanthes scabra]
MITPPRDLFEISEDADFESRQPFFGEHENSTSPAIPSVYGELVLKRIGLRPTIIEVVPQRSISQEHETDFIEDSDSNENNDIAELKATSSKSLIDKLKMFEINRGKLAKSRQNYGMQEVTSPTKRQICHVWELLNIREIKNTPTQQPENLESNHVPHDEPTAQGLNNSASVGRAANHELKRKLDATPKWNNTVPVTNALQEPSSANSAQITRNIDQ